MSQPAADRPPPWAVALLVGAVLVFVWTLGGLAVANWRLYYANGDLAIYDQATWLVAFGQPPAMTIRGMHVFAHHINLPLLPVALLYRLWPSPVTLLWLQALAAGVGAVPVWWVARRVGRGELAALAWAVLYLSYPPLHGMVLADFHYECFSLPCFLTALACAEARAWRGYALALGAALLCREDAGLAACGLGLGLALAGQRRIGLGTAVAGLGYTVALTKLVMPWFGSAEQAVFYREYFSHLGSSLGEIALSPLTRPGVLLRWLCDPQTGSGPLLCQLLGPLCFLSLLKPSWLAGAVLTLSLNLLSSFLPSRSINTHYQTLVMPFVLLAAVAGQGWLSARLAERGARPATARATPVVMAILGTWLLPLLLPGWFVPPLTAPWRQPAEIAAGVAHRPWAPELDRLIAALPADAAVAASPSILPRVSGRRQVWMFPAPFYWSPRASWRPFPTATLPPCENLDAAGLERLRGVFLARLEQQAVDWLLLRTGPAGGVPLPADVYAASVDWIAASGRYELVLATADIRCYRRAGAAPGGPNPRPGAGPGVPPTGPQ
ncbi:MAG: DUF2079 domain-containing protein [Fimbriimonadaceae bacterium]|nr:DUF2079 domain-containing protein [Fimbriimonadaceae bacterium]